jgi:hypothetical protein
LAQAMPVLTRNAYNIALAGDPVPLDIVLIPHQLGGMWGCCPVE